jgi:dGTPase
MPVLPKHARRWNDKSGQNAEDMEFGSDYDRILYSTAFRRLGGVTQVVASNEIALFHNRLTHSLKTAQVGARIAAHVAERYDSPAWRGVIQEYGGLNPRVVVAACMAHDLGHPPFGHIAEKELQYITSASPDTTERRRNSDVKVKRSPPIGSDYALDDRFEGNAQSFRIVTKLAFRESYDEDPAKCPALDLTRGVLAAMLKYPWGYAGRPDGIKIAPASMKWGFYEPERKIARWVFGGEHPRGRTVNLPGRRKEYRTVEAQVMDWADDISYAVHDVEDFFRAGIIPLDFLYSSENEWSGFFDYAWKGGVTKIVSSSREDVERLVDTVRAKHFPRTPYAGSRSDRERLHAFAASLIRDATDSTELREDGVVVADPEQLAIIEVLKELTWYYVIDRPSLESTQRGQRNIIRSLFSGLVEWIEEVWEGPRERTDGARGSTAKGAVPPGTRLSRRELPARLIDYLEVAFSTDEMTGCGEAYRENQKLARAAIDYIVSLTEMQAIELNSRLTGESVQSMLDGWFHF